MKIAAIIPARGGSKTIPRKNIKLLGGRPLIAYTILEALKSRNINRVIVSTEDAEIASIAQHFKAEVCMRPIELAQDTTPTLPVLQHVLTTLRDKENYQPDIIVLLQPTSPLRTSEDIDKTIDMFNATTCSSVVSVCEVDYPLHWMYFLDGDRLQPVMKDTSKVTRRQDAPKSYKFNGAVYVIHYPVLMIQNSLLGDDIRAFIMPPERSIDIDTELDFKIAELIMGQSE